VARGLGVVPEWAEQKSEIIIIKFLDIMHFLLFKLKTIFRRLESVPRFSGKSLFSWPSRYN
jgi:hypothetical protein